MKMQVQGMNSQITTRRWVIMNLHISYITRIKRQTQQIFSCTHNTEVWSFVSSGKMFCFFFVTWPWIELKKRWYRKMHCCFINYWPNVASRKFISEGGCWDRRDLLISEKHLRCIIWAMQRCPVPKKAVLVWTLLSSRAQTEMVHV